MGQKFSKMSFLSSVVCWPSSIFELMIKIEFPEPAFSIKTENGKEYILDTIRKKWVLLTPEEWVRQNFIQYLVQVKKYPATLIAVEKELQLGELKKRFDILVYNSSHEPWMMVECKEMKVRLDETVLQQLLRYTISIPVPYLVITNGLFCFGYKKKIEGLQEISELPEGSALLDK